MTSPTIAYPRAMDLGVSDHAAGTSLLSQTDATLGTAYTIGATSTASGDSTYDTEVSVRGLKDSTGTKLANVTMTVTVTFADGSSADIVYDNGSASVSSVSTPNTAPTASTVNGDRTVEAGDSITIDASASSDAENDTLSYEFAVDGASFVGMDSATDTMSFGSVGSHTITVRVTDHHGATDTTSFNVTVERQETTHTRDTSKTVKSAYVELASGSKTVDVKVYGVENGTRTLIDNKTVTAQSDSTTLTEVALAGNYSDYVISTDKTVSDRGLLYETSGGSGGTSDGSGGFSLPSLTPLLIGKLTFVLLCFVAVLELFDVTGLTK